MLILCNPHNPVVEFGLEEELKNYHRFVLKTKSCGNGFIRYFRFIHTPFVKVSLRQNNSITLMAPSKTFNIAGIVSSYAIISNKEIRDKYHSFVKKRGLDEGNLFAYTATVSAYNECDDWLDEMLKYVQSNVDFVDSYLKSNIPEIKAILPEASFLIGSIVVVKFIAE